MSPPLLSPNLTKQRALDMVLQYVQDFSLHITETNATKPWGAYIRFAESDIEKFAREFFPDQKISQTGLLTPKFLLVAPDGILSWQYHHRRAEIWKVIIGPIQAVQSDSDVLVEPRTYLSGSLISHGALVRHRLIGHGTWGLVAEIWQHTDPSQPSTEEDIVRLEDRYSRT